MSESNHVFTIDNRVISYSVYEQALKDIVENKKLFNDLSLENKLLKNQLCFTNSSWPHEKHLHKKIEQLQSDNEKLQAQVDVMREALEFYADKNNWCYEGMYNKNNDLPDKVEGPEDWYDSHSKMTNSDLEKHTNTMYFSGKRARQALAKLAEIKG